jgi:pimeloyl-ACP methyl ester carboxylesterase
MFVRRYGTGAQVIIGLHGWAGNHRTFEPLERWLPTDTSLFAFDLPGYGRSSDPRRWDLSSIAEELALEIGQLGIRRFTLVGNCSGAVVGLSLAQRLRDRIDRFVLIDPFAYVPWYFKVFLLGNFGRRAYHATFATAFGRAVTNSALKPRRTSHSNLTASFEEVRHESVHRYLQMMDSVGTIQKFGNLSMPIDLVYGERTFRAVKRSIELWHRLWPHSTVLELRGAGHLPIEETPQQLSEVLSSGRQSSKFPVTALQTPDWLVSR